MLPRCNLRTARLCAQAQALFDSTDRADAWVLELLQIAKEATIIDVQYQAWSDSTSGAWQCRELRTSLNVDMRAPSVSQTANPLYLYHDIWVAYVWNTYRCGRIHLNEVLSHCMALLHAHPSAQALRADTEAANIQSLISDLLSGVCGSVPFCLGSIDALGNPAKAARPIALCGYLVVWPLFVASVAVEPDSEMDGWIRGKLRYISDVMGIRRARTFADRRRKEAWNLG